MSPNYHKSQRLSSQHLSLTNHEYPHERHPWSWPWPRPRHNLPPSRELQPPSAHAPAPWPVPTPTGNPPSLLLHHPLTPTRPRRPPPAKTLLPPDYKLHPKHLDGRYTNNYLQLGEPSGGGPPSDKDDQWRDYALCIIRNFNDKHEHTGTDLEVKSPVIRNLLKRVIGERYPGVSFSTGKIRVQLPCKPLYHYLEELRREAGTAEGVEEEHISFFLQWLEEEVEAGVGDISAVS